MKTEAFAKVNLTLEVFGTRPDGYHALRSVVMPVALADAVEIERHAQLRRQIRRNEFDTGERARIYIRVWRLPEVDVIQESVNIHAAVFVMPLVRLSYDDALFKDFTRIDEVVVIDVLIELELAA